MDLFLYSLAASSLTATVTGAILYLLERMKWLNRIAASSKALLLLVLLLGLLFPVKPAVLRPLITLPKIIGSQESDNLSAPYDPVKLTPTDNTLTNTPVFTIEDSDTSTAAVSRLIQYIYPMLFLIWSTGFLLVLFLQFLRHRRFLNAILRWTEPEENSSVLCACNEARLLMGYKKTIELLRCPFIEIPVLTGMFRPKILLPCHSEQIPHLNLIIAHELAHAARKDILSKAVAVLSQAIHWFNPFVRLLSREFSLQCELACDAAVLSGTDWDIRRNYGTVLLCAARLSNKHPVTAFSSYFTGNCRQIKERVYATLEFSRKKKGLAILFAVTATVVLSGSVIHTINASTEKQSTIFPAYSTLDGKVYVTTNYSKGSVYPEDTAALPEGMPYMDAKINIEDLTYSYVDDIYLSLQLNKSKDSLAISMSDGTITVIEPDSPVPLSPTTAGSADWYIKAYIRTGDLWELNPTFMDMQELNRIAGDVLLQLVTGSYPDRESFDRAARNALADVFMVDKELFLLDINDAT